MKAAEPLKRVMLGSASGWLPMGGQAIRQKHYTRFVKGIASV